MNGEPVVYDLGEKVSGTFPEKKVSGTFPKVPTNPSYEDAFLDRRLQSHERRARRV
jgi:hypothetical protein